jgi:DNA-binding PadR family transcriptional regulator
LENPEGPDIKIMTDGGTPKPTRLEQLNLITQLTRATIIQNILGHCVMLPSLKELNYYNPRKSTGTISEHLDKLVDANIVMRVFLPQGERSRNLPSTFFTLTDEGFELLEYHSILVPALDKIRADHARLERTDDVLRYERAPRPTVDVKYSHPLKGDGLTIVDPMEAGDFDDALYAIDVSCHQQNRDIIDPDDLPQSV